MIRNKLEINNTKEVIVEVGKQAYLTIRDIINRRNSATIGMEISDLKDLRKLIKKTIKEYERIK